MDNIEISPVGRKSVVEKPGDAEQNYEHKRKRAYASALSKWIQLLSLIIMTAALYQAHLTASSHTVNFLSNQLPPVP